MEGELQVLDSRLFIEFHVSQRLASGACVKIYFAGLERYCCLQLPVENLVGLASSPFGLLFLRL